MILAGTGHRPNKLGGYGKQARTQLGQFLMSVLEELKPTEIISGMALGFDQAWAAAGIRLNIPVTAAIPCSDFDSQWSNDQRERYFKILNRCKVELLSKDTYRPELMQLRNVWMVNICNHLVALYDGSPGGTRNCLEYANKVSRPVLNIWPEWKKYIAA